MFFIMILIMQGHHRLSHPDKQADLDFRLPINYLCYTIGTFIVANSFLTDYGL